MLLFLCTDGDASVHIVCVKDGKPCGTVSLVLPETEGVARLYQMGVLDEYRGAGVGRALAEEALRMSRVHGMKRIHLHARHYAIPFYSAVGFQIDPTVPRFIEINMEHAEMFCEL